MLSEIMNRHNIEHALLQVERNKGVGGVDGMQTDKLRDYLNTHYRSLYVFIQRRTLYFCYQ
jgi:RNA-directed DNA polymerase